MSLTPQATGQAPETKSQTTPEETQFYKFKEISDFCLQSFAEKHQRNALGRNHNKHFKDPATHAKQMWRIQEEILEHKHKDVGKKLARMMGGVTFYSIHVLLPPGDNAYGVPEGERLFVRYRRWSSFNNLREQLENKGGFPVLPRTLSRAAGSKSVPEIVGSEHPGGPYLFPAKTRLFANKSTRHKRCSAFGKWLQCLLGHECEEVVDVTKQWLRSPDDGEGRVRPPTNEEQARLDEALRKPSNKRRLQKWLVDYHTKENTSRGHPNTWNTSQITNMSQLFCFKSDRSSLFPKNILEDFNEDISGWDVSNVTIMEEMFKDCEVFDQPIGNWDVSNVKNMKNMFRSAVAFDQSIDNWDVSNVENMASMFHRAKAFNQPIGTWSTLVSNVKNMSNMFQETEAFNQPIGDWHVSNVKDMHSMFYQARAFNQPIPWGRKNKFRTNGQDAIIWKEEHREKSNYREYISSEARRQRIKARTAKAAAVAHAAEQKKQEEIDAYNGPMSTPTDDQLVAVYGPDGPRLRAMAIATHVCWGIEWWDDWTTPLEEKDWNYVLTPNFKNYKIKWEAKEPSQKEKKYAPHLQRIVGIAFRNGIYSNLPKNIACIPLEIFDFPHCKRIEGLSNILFQMSSRSYLKDDCFVKMKSIEYIDIERLHGALPSSLSDCISLRELEMAWCANVSEPLDVSKLTNLTRLRSWANGIPDFIGCAALKNLVDLTITETDGSNNIFLEEYPSGLNELSKLEKLTLGPEKIEFIPPEIFENKPVLEEISFRNYENLSAIPESMYNLPSLKVLSFFQCGGGTKEPLELSERIGNLTKLERLSYTGKNPHFTKGKLLKLTCLPSSMLQLKALKNLNIDRAAIQE
jgi:surface protein